MQEGVLLPEPLEQQVEDLGDALQGKDLSPEEARRRIEELQQQLAAFASELETSRALMHDLETAARALDASPTEALSRALSEGELGEAGEAARALSEKLSDASPAERARAAKSLGEAGRALQSSSDPELARTGDGFSRASDALGDPGGLSQTGAEGLASDLEAADGLGDRLRRDAGALDRARSLEGALEGARQRLGGSPTVARGTSPDGTPSSAPGDAGEGLGKPGAEPQTSSPGAEGHTWEERSAVGATGSPGNDVRQSARTGGAHADDFERLYEGLRLDDATARLARIEGAVDRNGQVDQLPIRITGDAETAAAPTVTLPARYRAQAAEAIDAEPIPPAYGEAVKQYFDAMD
jgi:hypothetical protein